MYRVCLAHFTEHFFRISYFTSFRSRWSFFDETPKVSRRESKLHENGEKCVTECLHISHSFHETPWKIAWNRKYDKCVAGISDKMCRLTAWTFTRANYSLRLACDQLISRKGWTGSTLATNQRLVAATGMTVQCCNFGPSCKLRFKLGLGFFRFKRRTSSRRDEFVLTNSKDIFQKWLSNLNSSKISTLFCLWFLSKTRLFHWLKK